MKGALTRCLPLACAVLLAACSKSEPAGLSNCPPSESGKPVDSTLLAFLSRARAAHHLADDLEGKDDLTASTVPLERLVAGPLPRVGGELGPEVREVLADTYARLADLHSRQGQFERALEEVEQGLGHVHEPNYFRGHLLETQGLIEERHAKELEKKGDRAGAAAIRQRAIELLEQAMAVQSGVIERAPSSPTRPSTNASAAPPTPAASAP
ncbi:MAG TPA: hypothetical protein VFK05_34475 [Polyangiaceae bacterium]|nr:hypothetical protein [Polyangiaceae bacterium]